MAGKDEVRGIIKDFSKEVSEFLGTLDVMDKSFLKRSRSSELYSRMEECVDLPSSTRQSCVFKKMSKECESELSRVNLNGPATAETLLFVYCIKTKFNDIRLPTVMQM